jgi:hypothetical protein
MPEFVQRCCRAQTGMSYSFTLHCTARQCTALHCTDVTGIVCDDDAILQPPTPVIVARYMSDVLTYGGNAEVRFCPDVDCEGRYQAAFGLTRFQVRACVHTCSPCV